MRLLKIGLLLELALCLSADEETSCSTLEDFGHACLAPLRRTMSALEIEEECEILVWGVASKVNNIIHDHFYIMLYHNMMNYLPPALHHIHSPSKQPRTSSVRRGHRGCWRSRRTPPPRSSRPSPQRPRPGLRPIPATWAGRPSISSKTFASRAPTTPLTPCPTP